MSGKPCGCDGDHQCSECQVAELTTLLREAMTLLDAAERYLDAVSGQALDVYPSQALAEWWSIHRPELTTR